MKSIDIKERIESRFGVNLKTKRGVHFISKCSFAYYNVCIILCKFETYEQISGNLGKKHCSVNHALKRHDQLIRYDKVYQDIWREVRYLFNIDKRPININRHQFKIKKNSLKDIYKDIACLCESDLIELHEYRIKPFIKLKKYENKLDCTKR